jgi:hypothetical protein
LVELINSSVNFFLIFVRKIKKNQQKKYIIFPIYGENLGIFLIRMGTFGSATSWENSEKLYFEIFRSFYDLTVGLEVLSRTQDSLELNRKTLLNRSS